MTRVRAGAAATAITLLTASMAAQSFKSGVDVVRVDALVTEGDRPLVNLRPEDFELRDNGVRQTLAFASIESLPLSLVFVLDTSGSVAGSKMHHLASAVDVIVRALRKDDRAGLVTFSHRVWERVPVGPDFAALQAVVRGADASGATSLYDAVYAGLALSTEKNARPLVIVFSDGLDNASWLTSAAVEGAARRSGAVVYGVAVAARMRMDPTGLDPILLNPGQRNATIGFKGRPDYLPGQTAFLDAIASITGGRVLRADTTENLPRTFDEVLREFRTRYVLSYSPRGVDTPGWHTIEVRVRNRRADVKARSGYQR
jgi:VWFA-related protein